MTDIKNDLDEILYLNKEINYHLAQQGGSDNKIDDILEHNSKHIINRVKNMENYLLGLANENT